MGTNRELNIDPRSDALQYRIEEHGDVWMLRREYPEMPLTPDEHYAMAEIRAVMPTTYHDRIVVPEAAQDHLDSAPGDVVSIVTVADAQVQVMIDGISSALQPMMEAVEAVAEAFAGGLQSAMVDALTVDESSQDKGRESALPPKIQEARQRREEQREQERRKAGSRYPATDQEGDGAH
ncbi:hypothetical protein [Haloarcula onubensis]|uniref:Uncharacterized protein n=1 Tax=Haloarcula onubensis TaxID=2950539 RepID=A0ABU2FV88_9EURY|nr:hypothetical protein [Halomicroarcula sp. S3CR25-11]MDS0284695.1 hypothetical protein [Halomicroarcula sp. S3CR25-11]